MLENLAVTVFPSIIDFAMNFPINL